MTKERFDGKLATGIATFQAIWASYWLITYLPRHLGDLPLVAFNLGVATFGFSIAVYLYWKVIHHAPEHEKLRGFRWGVIGVVLAWGFIGLLEIAPVLTNTGLSLFTALITQTWTLKVIDIAVLFGFVYISLRLWRSVLRHAWFDFKLWLQYDVWPRVYDQLR